MSTTPNFTGSQLNELQELVQRKVRRFFGRRISIHDYEDACSQTMTQILAKLSRFDPNRGSLFHYLDMVADHSLRDHARLQRASKRHPQQSVGSLNALLHSFDDGFSELWQTLDEQQASRHRGDRRSTLNEIDLGIDFRLVIAQLPPDERSLLESKLAGESVHDLATKFAVCSGTIYRRLGALKKKLRKLATYA